MFLLDTNVISEFRKLNAGKGDPHVRAWVETMDAGTLYISAVTIFELEVGTLLVERRDTRQGAILRAYLDKTVLKAFAGRILPTDMDVARRCARLHVPNPQSELDSFIAATALVHGMTVVTRNVAHFVAMEVAVFNPWLP